jgi:hypothetical protein
MPHHWNVPDDAAEGIEKLLTELEPAAKRRGDALEALALLVVWANAPYEWIGRVRAAAAACASTDVPDEDSQILLAAQIGSALQTLDGASQRPPRPDLAMNIPLLTKPD